MEHSYNNNNRQARYKFACFTLREVQETENIVPRTSELFMRASDKNPI